VPAYGLGHDADGRTYYAMRLIDGDSLKDTIAAFRAGDPLKRDQGRRSRRLRKLLRRFVEVCNGIDYAHGRGGPGRMIDPAPLVALSNDPPGLLTGIPP
jgi:eukaryotic-like serine/threonine-protein kinase